MGQVRNQSLFIKEFHSKNTTHCYFINTLLALLIQGNIASGGDASFCFVIVRISLHMLLFLKIRATLTFTRKLRTEK